MFGRFIKDCKGGVAPFLALSILPIMGFIGAGVDFSRASSARTAMQQAIDSTALMLSRDAQTMTASQLTAKRDAYFGALFKRSDVPSPTLTHTFSSPQQGNFSITVNGTGQVQSKFVNLLGTSQMNITAKSTVVWGIKKLNLALVLDNTGSMSSNGKMTALKQASHNLLNTLQAAAKQPGDVLVSIVPFATDVNVGTSNYNQSWIRWTDWDAENGSNVQTCSGSGSNRQCNTNWVPMNHNTWNGCVEDRDQNSDTLNTTPISSGTRFPAHEASACPVAMMPLSENWSALHNKIDAMTPTGNTNVTIGLVHGWQTLSTGLPWNAPAAATDLDKVIILLTDGENTQNRWSTSTSSVNTRTQKACDNVKAAGIKLYTVRVIDGNATLLKNCATNPDMYYDVDQASELNGVFSSIAQNLANLRIAK